MQFKVKIGTLMFEQGVFSKGDIIEVTQERAKLFDPRDIEPVQTQLKAAVMPAPVEPVKIALEPKPTSTTKKATPVKPAPTETATIEVVEDAPAPA